MLKRRITKTEFEALPEALQSEYKKASGSDNYDLDAEADTGPSDELKRAKDREKQRADAAERKAREAEERLEELENQQTGALDATAVTKLKADHKVALDKAKTDAEALVKAKHAQIEEILLDGEALRLATDISTVPDVFKDVIRKRLTLDEADGKPVVKVLGEDGTVSDMKVEALGEEYMANEKYAAILTGSKASGSGASGSSKGGRATAKKLSEMSATEEAAFANEKPAEYERMLAAENGATA